MLGCKPRTRVFIVFALTLLFSAAWLYAQDTAAPPAADAAISGQPTMIELFKTAPKINGIIAALSVLALGLFLFFIVTISTAGFAPAPFVDDLTKLVISGKYEQAANLCRNNRNIFVASIVQRCVENAGKSHSAILGMLDAEGRRRADIVWNRISYLADISNVAPMLGLLGTVWGMIKAFFGLKLESASVNSGLLSNAIGTAMATTLFGLTVGILSLVFYSIVKGRVTRTLAEAEQVVHSVADHIKRQENN